MCGVCGFIKTPSSRNSSQILSQMVSTLFHRGPDEEGVYEDAQVSLGVRRLSIIDLQKGSQPKEDCYGKVVVFFNGEIYNYQELRRELIRKGHNFSSNSDTEVLPHLYEEYGEKFISKVEGMFAIVVYDRKTQVLYLYRDRFGIKPLYYYIKGEEFVFASEIKAILAFPGIEREVNLQALSDYLSFAYIPGEETIFKNIYSLPPGHFLKVKGKSFEKKRYFELTYPENPKLTEREAIEGIIFYLKQAVKRQLISDVPLGVLLSGGMDSSAITAMMRTLGVSKIKTFSVGFSEPSFDERSAAREVACHLNTEHYEINVGPAEVLEVLEKQISYFDEPFADGAAIPTYYVSKLAREQVKVVLSGEGGDELFAGYDTHKAYYVQKLYQRVPEFIHRRIISPVVSALPVSEKKLSFEFKAKRFVKGRSLSVAEAHFWWRVVLTEEEKKKCLKDECYPLQSAVRIFQERFERCQAEAFLNRLLYIDTTVFLPGDLLVKNDRMSMAHSLEARVPMLDTDLVCFCATLPAALKLKFLFQKYLLRKAMKSYLPRKIIYKKKIGLDMPISKWLKNELKKPLQEFLSAPQISEIGFFNYGFIENLISEHLSFKKDNWRALWTLLNFVLWYYKVFKNYSPGRAS